MKIEIGKIYKNDYGKEVYIEACLKVAGNRKFPYMGAYLGGGFDWFNESGEICKALYDSSSKGNLRPNTAKKIAWCVIYKSTRSVVRSEFFSSKDEAEKYMTSSNFFGLDGCRYCCVGKVEWEEEE